MLTTKELRELLRYDENTGYFYWNNNGTFKVKAVRARKSAEQKYRFFAKEDYNNVDF